MRNDISTAANAFIVPAQPAQRRSRQAIVRWGDRVVTIGGDAPVRVQAMTNTDTVDAIGTAIQVKELAIAGSELVRITVNTPEAAAASGVLTVMRTSSEPAIASSLTWIAVPIASTVSVLVIACTRTGASPPTVTTCEPQRTGTWRERRAAGMAGSM